MFRFTVSPRQSVCRTTLAVAVAAGLLIAASENALAGVDVVPADPNDWPMYNHDPEGTRHNIAEHILSPATVGDLEVLWRFETPGAKAGTPAVVKDTVYAADSTGTVYALSRDGALRWSKTLDIASPFGISLTVSPLVTNRTVIIGDLAGQVHGLDKDTGEVRRTTRPPSPGPVFGDQHPFQSIFGSATMVGNHMAIGIASTEEAAAALVPDYPCCTF